MSLFRPAVERLAPYVPGEQPQETGWVKLNTNENPYPPSPRVVEAIQRAAVSRLNLYPDPLATRFRQVAAGLFGVDAEWILPANGSDENLTMIIRSFIDPGDVVAYPYPSYILYETLVEIQGGRPHRVLLNDDWSWNAPRCAEVLPTARMCILPSPNSPSGTQWSLPEITRLVPPRGVLILDEAYGDFSDSPHAGEILREPCGDKVVITRTLSKSYSLAGLRMGFAVAHPDLIRGMRKVKDSYNCDAIAIAAGTAALEDQAWMRANAAKIRQTRAFLSERLAALGFRVTPSQANFVWCTHPERSHRELYEQLKQRKILVRYMKFQVPLAPQGVFDGLRITIGTPSEIDQLLAALTSFV